MKRFVVAAVAIATAFSGVAPARAFPIPAMQAESPSQAMPVDWNRSGWSGGHSSGNYDRRDYYYHRGYSGHHGYYYRDYDRGYYHHHSDTGAVLGGLALGMIVGGVIAQSQAHRGSHAQWCYSRYRSYRAWDNTYQPLSGPRRPCR